MNLGEIPLGPIPAPLIGSAIIGLLCGGLIGLEHSSADTKRAFTPTRSSRLGPRFSLP